MGAPPMTLQVDLKVRQDEFSLEAAFSVEAGQTVAIIGPNGSGKSTLLAALAGHLRIKSGSIRFEEQTLDGSSWTAPEDRPVAFVPQDGLLFPHMTVLDNVLFGLRHGKAGRLNKDEQNQRCLLALDAVDMAGSTSRLPGELSGGQAQRVAVARALVLQQPLLLLDEPLSRIDVSNRRKIRQVLAEHRPAGQVQVIVTHGADHAITADLLLALEGGAVTAFGPPAELRAAPPTEWIRELLS